jgi:hypothetical protein
VLRNTSMARACVLITTVLVAGTASPVRAQYYGASHRFEITPFGSYQWGGSFNTNSFATIPAGELSENGSFAWGAVMSFLAERYSAAELYYLRQDTKVEFAGVGAGKREVGDFANNYIQLGVRQGIPNESNVIPFITASLGVNILDPKSSSLGTSTRFAWSLGGGGMFMQPGKRVGVRMDVKWMVTPVPSGTYGTWCDYWGCYVTEGTSWLHQGSAGAGLVIAF